MIPTSNALSEAFAGGDSLSEAVSRFDAHIIGGTTDSAEARQALRTIILRNREQRERWKAAETSGATSSPRVAKTPLGKKIIGATPEDLGL